MARGKKDKDTSSDVNNRLGKLLVYKKLSEGTVLSDTSSEVDAMVEKELQAFIKDRIEVLMGLKPDPTTDRERNLDKQLQSIYNMLKELKSDSFSKEQQMALTKIAEITLKSENVSEPMVAPPIQSQPIPQQPIQHVNYIQPPINNNPQPVPEQRIVQPPPGAKRLPQPTSAQMDMLAAESFGKVDYGKRLLSDNQSDGGNQ